MVINSIAAIDPAMVAFPVTMKLMMKVSTVPVIRQLTAFAKDRPWASRPRNNATACSRNSDTHAIQPGHKGTIAASVDKQNNASGGPIHTCERASKNSPIANAAGCRNVATALGERDWQDMGTIIINGRRFDGNDVAIRDGKVVIDGKPQAGELRGGGRFARGG